MKIVTRVLISLMFGLPCAEAQTFTVLKSFTDQPDGAIPVAGVVLSGRTLFGTTTYGGVLGMGTVFKMDIDGSGYTVLWDFGFASNVGASPTSLLLNDGTLFGTTTKMPGDLPGAGTVFKIDTNGAGMVALKLFTNSVDGESPFGGLILNGDTLYGTTMGGGSAGRGTVFKVNTDGTGFAVIKSFSGADGGDPEGTLLLSGNTLYGTTADGGIADWGTVFKINTDGTGFSVLRDFFLTDGAAPKGSLVLSGNTLYGTTLGGEGSASGGTIFKINTDGSDYGLLWSFTNSLNGTGPQAGLMMTGGVLYGTTFGGGDFDFGTIFKLNTNGTEFASLKSFTGTDGINPLCRPVLGGSVLYGTTYYGSGSGTVFSLNLAPVMQTVIPTNGIVQAVWRSINGFNYQVQTSTDVRATNWINLGDPVLATNNVTAVSSHSTDSQRFYRVMLLP